VKKSIVFFVVFYFFSSRQMAAGKTVVADFPPASPSLTAFEQNDDGLLPVGASESPSPKAEKSATDETINRYKRRLTEMSARLAELEGSVGELRLQQKNWLFLAENDRKSLEISYQDRVKLISSLSEEKFSNSVLRDTTERLIAVVKKERVEASFIKKMLLFAVVIFLFSTVAVWYFLNRRVVALSADEVKIP
jgi:hypothetical protein